MGESGALGASLATLALEEAQEDALTIEDLPDQILGLRILSLLDPQQSGPALTLVCRRWRRVYFTETSVWGTLRMEAGALHLLSRPRQVAWLATKRKLIERIGPLVTALAVHDRTNALEGAASAVAAASAAPATAPVPARGPAAAPAAGAGTSRGCCSSSSSSSTSSRSSGSSSSSSTSSRSSGSSSSGSDSIPSSGSSGSGRGGSGSGGEGGGCRLEDLLLLLQPGVLQEVELECHPSPPAAALEALPRFARQLTALNLDCRSLPPAVAVVLPQLSQLRSLRMGAADLGGCMGACATLRQLTRLELESNFFPLPPLAPLAALPALSVLRVVDDSQRPDSQPLLIPPPAEFRGGKGLETLTVYARTPCKVAEARLRYLLMHPVPGPPPMPSSPHASLNLLGRPEAGQAAWLGSLAALLAVLLPAGTPLWALSVHGCQLDVADVACCSARLADIKSLHLDACTGSGGGSIEAALEALLQAPGEKLVNLKLKLCPMGAVPACVVHKEGLLHLALENCGLTDLPDGSFLHTLQEVDLTFNVLTRLPASLAAATCMRRLLLDGNAELVLTWEEVESTLLGLPHLQFVGLTGTQTQHADVAQRLACHCARQQATA